MTTKNRPAILRFAALSWAEQSFFLRAMWLLPVMACATRLFGLQKVQTWVEGYSLHCEKSKAATEAEANAIARMVFSAARYGVVHGNCLSRSLTLCYLLSRGGCDAFLRLGGRREDKAFEAHAWVELGGRTFDGPDDMHELFKPFPVHPTHELKPVK